MLFKLSIKNIKKSFRDYAIYFITLVLGVAIFYMFNSLDSGQAMLKVSRISKRDYKTYDKHDFYSFYICCSDIRIINCICK